MANPKSSNALSEAIHKIVKKESRKEGKKETNVIKVGEIQPEKTVILDNLTK
jgi:hypothetical protein